MRDERSEKRAEMYLRECIRELLRHYAKPSVSYEMGFIRFINIPA